MSKHLMAKMRRNAVVFDWRDIGDEERTRRLGLDPALYRGYRAPLENGDHLAIHSNEWPDSPTGVSWGYSLLGPREHHDTDPRGGWGDPSDTVYHRYETDPEGQYSPVIGTRSPRETGPAPLWTPEDAIKAAEEHYQGLDRRNAAPSRDHEYNIAPASPFDEPEDGYDIFGDRP